MKLDKIDIKILDLLQKNAKLTFKDISEKINLSLSPTHDRIKRLEKEGLIHKQVCLLDKKSLGIGLTVYSLVTLSKQTKETAELFVNEIKRLHEVVECSFVSGSFDFLLKILVPDMDAYHSFHQQRLSGIEGVSLINSIFVLKEEKYSTEIPLRQLNTSIKG